jgi:hypothetical protein
MGYPIVDFRLRIADCKIRRFAYLISEIRNPNSEILLAPTLQSSIGGYYETL